MSVVVSSGGAVHARSPRNRETLPGGRVFEIPYLAGGPARIWHRAGIAAGRLSGFTGPVPPPLLIRVFSCGRDGRRRRCRWSTSLLLALRADRVDSRGSRGAPPARRARGGLSSIGRASDCGSEGHG